MKGLRKSQNQQNRFDQIFNCSLYFVVVICLYSISPPDACSCAPNRDGLERRKTVSRRTGTKVFAVSTLPSSCRPSTPTPPRSSSPRTSSAVAVFLRVFIGEIKV